MVAKARILGVTQKKWAMEANRASADMYQEPERALAPAEYLRIYLLQTTVLGLILPNVKYTHTKYNKK